MSLLLTLLSLLILIPICMVLHEIGHAIYILISTKDVIVEIYSGWSKKSLLNNKKGFQVGRVHFYIKWGYYSTCFYKDNAGEMDKPKNISFLLSGLLFSFILSLIPYLFLLNYSINADLSELISDFVFYNFAIFILNIIPIKSPSWFYGTSDTFLIYKLIKDSR